MTSPLGPNEGTIQILVPMFDDWASFGLPVAGLDRAPTEHGQNLRPGGLDLVRLGYLDTIGLLACLGNRLVVRTATPEPRRIAFWDRVLVRATTAVDLLLRYTLGKSVPAVWQKRDPGMPS